MHEFYSGYFTLVYQELHELFWSAAFLCFADII